MRRKPAFTRAELLLLVVLVSLHVWLVLPALASRGRAQAKRLTCAAQLRQIALAVQAYAADNEDRTLLSIGNYPYITGMYKPDHSKRYGLMLLLPYLGADEPEILAGVGPAWRAFQCPSTEHLYDITTAPWSDPGAMLLKVVYYLQYCGVDNPPTHPGSHTMYSRMAPGVVLFSDSVGCYYGTYIVRWANHEMIGSDDGEFIGANAARVDGGADWTPVPDSGDLALSFILVDGGVNERSYLYPKPKP